MKQLSLIAITLLLFGYQSKAQLAVVNTQKVMASIPEVAKIDTLIMKETASYAAEFNKKQADLNKLVKHADSLYQLDAKALNTTKAIEIAQTGEKDLKAFADVANKKLAEYKQLVQKPYIEKIMAAINAVALRGKLMQVVDNKSVSILYLNPLSDITELVLKELKVK